MLKSEVKNLAHEHTYGTWMRQELWASPLLIVDAQGVYMVDESGRTFLDFSSQLMCSNLGHRNQAIIEAIVKQAEKLPYTAPGFVTEAMLEAVQALWRMACTWQRGMTR